MDIYNIYSINDSIEELDMKMKELKKIGNMISYSISLFLISLGAILYYSVLEELWFFGIFGGSALLVFVIGTLIRNASVNHVMKNKYLNEEAVKLYNSENETEMEYSYNPRNRKTFNEEMGLFTRFSSASTRYKIQVDANTKLIYTTLQTNSGQSNQVHFAGVYVIFDIPGYSNFQVRTHGKPHQKGIKFVREEDEDYKIYKLEEEDRIRLNYNSVLSKLEDFKKKYIASNGRQVHIAFTPFKPKFNNSKIEYDSFQEYYHQIESLLNLVSQIRDIITL